MEAALRFSPAASATPSASTGIPGRASYRITLVRLSGDQAVSYEPFAEGWLQGRHA
jgi:hypothetical protein